MNDPKKFILLPRVVVAFLVAASMCSDVNAQSFFQQSQTAVDKTDNPAWQPPHASAAKPQSVIRQATNMVPLKPPRDIFAPEARPLAKPLTARPAPTSPPVARTAWNQLDSGSQIPRSQISPPDVAVPPQPERFSTSGQFDGARRLSRSSDAASSGNGLFDTINALTESSQPEFASANLDFGSTPGHSNLDAPVSYTHLTLPTKRIV